MGDVFMPDEHEIARQPRPWNLPSGDTPCDTTAFDLTMLPYDQGNEGLLVKPQASSSIPIVQANLRKRAQKAATMSPEKWAPAENRLRQLYLIEEASIKSTMKTINREFGFTAT